MQYFWIYLATISLISVLVTLHDKRAAKHRKRRTPETALLTLSALGGSAAMYITMRIIHHKTLHKKFMLGIPFIILAQICVFLWVRSFFL